MALLSIIWLLTSITVSTSSSATDQLCQDKDDAPLSIELMTDKYPAETSWNIRNTLDDSVVLEGGPYTSPLTLHNVTHCLLSTGCLEFSIDDSFGDGMCCEDYQGNGYYRVFYDNYLIKEGGVFKHRETSVKFGGNCMLDSSFKPSTSPSSESSKESACNSKYPLATCGSGVGGQQLVFFGMGPHESPLRECAGHCGTDSDCQHDLVCFQREEGMDTVPGCYTVPFGDINYCISQTQFDSYSNVQTKSSEKLKKSEASSKPRRMNRNGEADHGLDEFSVFLILLTVGILLAICLVTLLYVLHKMYLCVIEGNLMNEYED